MLDIAGCNCRHGLSSPSCLCHAAPSLSLRGYVPPRAPTSEHLAKNYEWYYDSRILTSELYLGSWLLVFCARNHLSPTNNFRSLYIFKKPSAMSIWLTAFCSCRPLPISSLVFRLFLLEIWHLLYLWHQLTTPVIWAVLVSVSLNRPRTTQICVNSVLVWSNASVDPNIIPSTETRLLLPFKLCPARLIYCTGLNDHIF